MKISTKKQWRLILNLQISTYVCKLLEKCNLVKLCSYTWQYHMFNYPTVKGICQKKYITPFDFLHSSASAKNSCVLFSRTEPFPQPM